MRLTTIQLRDLRNYREFSLTPATPVTVLVGRNASGKTNLLEAICVACRGSSFRRGDWADLVRWGEDRGTVRLEALGGDSPQEIELSVKASGAREWVVNGKKRRAGRGLVPVVTFTPDDLAFVKGPAEGRRSAVDTFGSSLSSAYSANVREYGRVLRQRNALLKDSAVRAEDLAPWTEALVERGARLTSYRGRLLARMGPLVRDAIAEIGGERLEVMYADRAGMGDAATSGAPVEDIEEALRAELILRAPDERARGVSLAGPHRADVVFLVGGHDARSSASQGQQRSVVLAWKLAEAATVREVTGRRPVVLLDDVMSELDAGRRHSLGSLIGAGEQTFITTTNIEYFEEDLLEEAGVVEVSAGG